MGQKRSAFPGREDPVLTVMCQARTPQRFLELARAAADRGGGAVGLQLDQLEREYRTPANYETMLRGTRGLPVYATNYRHSRSEGLSDEALAEQLLALAERGAALCDIMGDYYDPTPGELTRSAAAADRQRSLIGRVHDRGAGVLMSSHVLRFLPTEQVLEIAKTHEARGADVSKIVTAADTDEELMENLETVQALRRELKIPFLFLAGGSRCRLQRMIGPMLGCCMWLCVTEYDELATKTQPLLGDILEMRRRIGGPCGGDPA